MTIVQKTASRVVVDAPECSNQLAFYPTTGSVKWIMPSGLEHDACIQLPTVNEYDEANGPSIAAALRALADAFDTEECDRRMPATIPTDVELDA